MTGPDDGPMSDDIEAQILALDPRHWAEARERVTALRAYLALPAPTQKDAESIAASVGISRARFYDVVRRWRDTGLVAVLVPHASAPPTRSDRLLEEVVSIINSATDEIFGADRGANADQVWRSVVKSCEARMLIAPSRVTVRRRVAKRLAGGEERRQLVGSLNVAPSRRAIQIDRAAIGLRCRGGEGRVGLPTLGLAVIAGTGQILAATVGFDQPFSATVARLMRELLTKGVIWTPETPEGLPIEVDRQTDAEWNMLASIMDGISADVCWMRSANAGSGRRIKRLVLSRLGPFPLITHAVRDGAEERLRRYGLARLPDTILGVPEITRALDHAIATHNRPFSVARLEVLDGTHSLPDDHRTAAASLAALEGTDAENYLD